VLQQEAVNRKADLKTDEVLTRAVPPFQLREDNLLAVKRTSGQQYGRFIDVSTLSHAIWHHGPWIPTVYCRTLRQSANNQLLDLQDTSIQIHSSHFSWAAPINERLGNAANVLMSERAG
jgi:hypothetical protein